MVYQRSWSVLGLAALLATLAGLVLFPSTRSSAQVEQGATMTVLRGQVAVVRADGSAIQPAPSGIVVNAGDEIRTLGLTSALITFFAGTEIELDQNTTIAVEQVSKQGDRIDIALKQAFGATVNRVQTLTGTGSTYRIDAGGAVALVRGTTFVVLGPVTTSVGNVVIIVCGADCSPASTFAGCPLQPFLGYAVTVQNGRVESSCVAFAVSRTADLTSAAFEAITTAEQELQGDTRGIPPGQVQPGQQQEIATQDRRREREQEEDDKPNQVSAAVVPTVSINDATVPEGTSATFTVTLSQATTVPVTITFVTTNGTAVAPADYTAAANTLTIPAGATTGTIVVPTAADLVVEPPENFALNLTGATNATIADSQGVGTIFDTGTLTLTINDVTATEGSNAVFTVTLSGPSSQPVTVNFTTANGTATAPGDYLPQSGTLTFPPGTTTQTISVPLLSDTASPAAVGAAAVEPPETFFVNLSSANGATIADAQGQGTILDPATLTASINDTSATEGGNLTFTVSLSAPSSQQVTVTFASANGVGTAGAVAPGDYGAVGNTLTFAPGTTSQTIVVTSVDDAIDELDEVFAVNLTGATVATIADSQGVGTILDNDATAVSINDVTVTEGTGGTTNATFTVSLSLLSSQPVTVSYSTANGSAVAPGDYTATTNGSVTIPAGSPNAPLVVPIVPDNLDELDETFTVTLASPTVGTIGTGTGTATIQDDDTAVISIVDVSLNEGNICTGSGGDPPCSTTTFPFTVTLNPPSDRTVQVSFSTELTLGTASGGPSDACAGASADGDPDYVSTSGTLTFLAGETSKSIDVPVCHDEALLFSETSEGDETFFVTLSGATNDATIAPPGRGQGTIRNDDTIDCCLN